LERTTDAAHGAPLAGCVRRRRDREALADAPRSGRPVVADVAYLRAMEEAVDSSPRELGLGFFDVWTSERLLAYLARTTGTRK
jgi:hypothetical protein